MGSGLGLGLGLGPGLGLGLLTLTLTSPGRTRTSSPRRSGGGDVTAAEPAPRSSVRRVVDPAADVAGVTSVHGRPSLSRGGGGG